MYKESKHLSLGYKKFCVYCGKESLKCSEIDDREIYYYYYCNCPEALKEISITEVLWDLEKKLPKENKQLVAKLKFDYEVSKLKDKYDIKD